MTTSRKTASRRPAKQEAASPASSGGFWQRLRPELGLIAGIVTTVIFFTIGKAWLADLDNLPLLLVLFAWLFGVMIWCAFGVVRHADALAELLGEPYGTLILTVSVISIEVTILAMVMLGGTPNPTLPRETMFAILMIVLNGMVGTVLAIGGLRHVEQEYNLQGAMAYLAVITPLAVIALVVPTFTRSTDRAHLHHPAGSHFRCAHRAALRRLPHHPDHTPPQLLHPAEKRSRRIESAGRAGKPRASCSMARSIPRRITRSCCSPR